MLTKKKINISFQKTRILISPLDWGLGHAARCIPLIKELLLNNCEVLIGAESATAALLKVEFPQIKIISLKGYRLKFSSSKKFFLWKMILQLPKIIYNTYYEKQWLKKIIRQYKIGIVISDNRVGLYNKNITSIYVTHQLLIKTGTNFTSKIAGRIHTYFINKYDECWVPDFETKGLAGELSHPAEIPKNAKYIGPLSRFKIKNDCEIKFDLVIILSGPEPQRTIFENLLLKDLKLYNGEALLIRGLPGDTLSVPFIKPSIEIVNHLSADELSEAIQQAKIIISRSGYTTIMDLVKLNKNAILIPTPGQAEQEYLAAHLKEKKMFFSVEQQNFNLTKSLKEFYKFETIIPLFDMDKYKSAIKNLIFQHNNTLR